MDGEHARVRPNRVALTIVLAVGLAAGLVPFLLYLQVLYLAVPYFVYAAIVVSWRGRGFIGNATERPDLSEWLLAGWNAVGVGATASMVGFIWYGLSYIVVWAVGYGAHALGWTLEMNPTSIAAYVSAFFFTVFALAVPVLVADEVPSKLYPQIAGTRSPFFPLAFKPWRLAMLALLGVTGGAAGVAFLDVQGLWFTLSLMLFFVATGVPLFKLGEPERHSAGAVLVMKALSKLLSAAGYKLTEKPRTGSPEVDPLITPVDLLAFAGNRGYAIKVKVVGSGETDLEWVAASDIRRAAKALQRALRSDNSTEAMVEPYLLVIGGRISDDLRSFSGEEGVKLVHFPDTESLRPALEPEAADSDLRGIALRLLQVSPGGPALPENAPSMAAAAG
jgi:hypothetical protein